MWSRKFRKCISCGTTKVRHWAKGLCKKCYHNTEKHKEWEREYQSTEKQKERRRAYHSKPEIKKHYAELQREYRKKHPEYVKWNKKYIKKNRKRYSFHEYVRRLKNPIRVKKQLKKSYERNKHKYKYKSKPITILMNNIRKGHLPKNKKEALKQIKILQKEIKKYDK